MNQHAEIPQPDPIVHNTPGNPRDIRLGPEYEPQEEVKPSAPSNGKLEDEPLGD